MVECRGGILLYKVRMNGEMDGWMDRWMDEYKREK